MITTIPLPSTVEARCAAGSTPMVSRLSFGWVVHPHDYDLSLVTEEDTRLDNALRLLAPNEVQDLASKRTYISPFRIVRGDGDVVTVGVYGRILDVAEIPAAEMSGWQGDTYTDAPGSDRLGVVTCTRGSCPSVLSALEADPAVERYVILGEGPNLSPTDLDWLSVAYRLAGVA